MMTKNRMLLCVPYVNFYQNGSEDVLIYICEKCMVSYNMCFYENAYMCYLPFMTLNGIKAILMQPLVIFDIHWNFNATS